MRGERKDGKVGRSFGFRDGGYGAYCVFRIRKAWLGLGAEMRAAWVCKVVYWLVVLVQGSRI
jgi:hypothetical protein